MYYANKRWLNSVWIGSCIPLRLGHYILPFFCLSVVCNAVIIGDILVACLSCKCFNSDCIFG